MSNKIKNRRELYSVAKKYLDMRVLFPDSEYVGRAPLTDYQARKISHELRRFAALSGGENKLDKLLPSLKEGKHYLAKDFVPIKRTKSAKRYFEEALIPKASRGVLLPGGAKINKNVKVKDGALFYDRGETASATFPLDAITEKRLSKSLRKKTAYVNNPENVAYIGTASGKISGVNVLVDQRRGIWQRAGGVAVSAELEGDKAIDKLENLALSIFLKYSAMAGNKEYRMNGRRAAHPSKWGMSLIIEAK